MTDSNGNSTSTLRTTGRRQVAIETALVFVVFFIQGAWPVPDVNEPYYLGKAIHFWNPDWAAGDFFLDSADTHQVFYFTFGWLSLALSPLVLAWTGRVLTWGLLAWAWRRLSQAVVPRPWMAVLTAGLFVCLQERCQMAGEWIVGGVEAKGFAYVLVLFGLEALVRGRWNRTWLFLGAASAFHVLVGGWAVVAAAIAWLIVREDRPRLLAMGPALLGGLLLSLPGLLPSLWLTVGAEADVVGRANEIYVFGRLAHHLVPSYFPISFLVRFLALLVVLALLDRAAPCDEARRRLRAFVAGTMAIALAGMAINVLILVDEAWAARLLRFYWFRLGDVMVPLGVALFAGCFIGYALRDGAAGTRPAVGRGVLVLALLIAGAHVGWHAAARLKPTVPRADRVPYYAAWRRACHWVATSGDVPAEARFLTPAVNQTFKWHTGRAEVVNWKEIPQDAGSIVRWWKRMHEVHHADVQWPGQRWRGSLAELGAPRLRALGAEYDAQYVITLRSRDGPALPVVFVNEAYVIYRIEDEN